MSMDFNWFQIGPLPADVMIGTYNLKLVFLSYVIATLASFVALDLAGRLRAEKNAMAKVYWLLGGAFAMGAGIWSMHFIGMLAFIMPMPMSYEISWTASSLLVAILASGFALFILRNRSQKLIYLLLGGVFIGLGIATMHYMGMEGMTNAVTIRYLPGLFFISILIAIFAAEAALWLALQANQGSASRQLNLKIISALVMGVAICGMHYVGMTAAVFTPLKTEMMQHQMTQHQMIQPEILAFFVAGITGLIISLALTVSTYYKHLVNAVQNEKEFLNAMLDHLEDGIIACDSKGKITLVNQVLQNNINASANKINVSNEEILQQFELSDPDEKKTLSHQDFPLFRALRGEHIKAMELALKFKNNLVLDVVIDGQPIINLEGRKLGAVIVIHDVTQIKKSEKMKSEFVSVVSHELRTPLTSIRGSLGLLLGGTVGDFPPKATRLLDIANKNCERLLLLINDILDMDKIQAGKMKFDLKILNINELVKEAMITNKLYCDKYNVTIKLTEAAFDVGVYADPDRLLQVLANLISNAAKFSPEHDVISIAIQREKNNTRVSITDKGPGIPLEFQPRIFQKFSQADSSDTRGKGGTGLGLSISKAIIEKLGGTINFISSPEQGTTFYFTLPTYQLNEENNAENTVKKPVKKLLICEDDEDQANYLSVLLEEAGFSSDIAPTVAKARKLIKENNYYAILLDLILPDQDGITFIRELRAVDETREIPIIVISVITETGKALLNGDLLLVLDWLSKPVDFSKLLATINRIKPGSEHQPHILHVEDDKDTQHIISSLLEGKARLTQSATIRETIEILKKEKFDLIILDMLLPDGKGSELMPLFAKHKLPVIVFSAFDLDDKYSKYVKEALVKSKISNDELLNTIKKYVLNDRP